MLSTLTCRLTLHHCNGRPTSSPPNHPNPVTAPPNGPSRRSSGCVCSPTTCRPCRPPYAACWARRWPSHCTRLSRSGAWRPGSGWGSPSGQTSGRCAWAGAEVWDGGCCMWCMATHSQCGDLLPRTKPTRTRASQTCCVTARAFLLVCLSGLAPSRRRRSARLPAWTGRCWAPRLAGRVC
jgi:hypothetical protein